jgi:hypothetical protein
VLITMINIPLGLPLRIIRKPAKPLAATALSGEGGSFPLIGCFISASSVDIVMAALHEELQLI